MEPVSVIVVYNESASLEQIQRLLAAPPTVLPSLSILNGFIDPGRIEELKQLRGIVSVEPERQNRMSE